jgi:hypothetical protein
MTNIRCCPAKKEGGQEGYQSRLFYNSNASSNVNIKMNILFKNFKSTAKNGLGVYEGKMTNIRYCPAKKEGGQEGYQLISYSRDQRRKRERPIT